MKLRCVDDSNQKVLKVGEVYTVIEIEGHRVYIEEYRRYSFLLSRFEVVNE